MVNPKEKAEELCKKMLYEIEWNAQPSVVKSAAKKCALIAVCVAIDEVNQNFTSDRYAYWQQVKSETEKL